MPKKKKHPVLENIEILELAAEGKSIAKTGNMVVFVTHDAVPGDIVDLQVKKKRKNYYEAYPVRFIKYSDKREQPVCQYFGTCGGCKWQNLKYEEQIKYKEKQVADQLTRIGKAELKQVNPIVSCDNLYFYRNKLEFAFSNKRWITKEEVKTGEKIYESNALGFHIPGRFDKVLDIEKCYLQRSPSNEIRQAIKQYAEKNKLEYFDLVEQKGFLRNLIIRTTSTGEVMVILSFFKNDKQKIHFLLEHLKKKFGLLSSIMYVINPKPNDTINDLDICLFSGKDHIIEELDGLKFKIGPKSFFQTNSEQALKLYKIARDFADLKGNEVVYDLYTGTGTIANYLAKNAAKVIGIEYIEGAVIDARENSKINNIHNTNFFTGDIKDVLTVDFMTLQGKPDVIVLDPPRAGIHPGVIKAVLFALPQKIVYISCNPATQARDILLLSEKYKITEIQPVDMFPHTHHVENVLLLEKF